MNRCAERKEVRMARYTLIAGTCNWSSWSQRPYLALAASGAAFETIVIPLRQPETKAKILEHSPSGKVPLLEIEEASSSEAVGHNKSGRTLAVWDSLAICEAVAERHPEAGLWPRDRDVRAIARCYAAEMHSGFPDVRDQLGLDFVGKKPMPELREDTQAQLDRILESWERALAAHKGDFLFGGFGVADCMYGPVVSRLETYGVAVSPAVRGYMDRVLALPGMQAWRKLAQAEVDAGLGDYPSAPASR
jgi:glutathione S-transferase